MPDTLLSLALGAIGWFGANLLINPWVEVLKLRKEVQEELTFLSNVDPPNSGTLCEQGEEAYQNEIQMFQDSQQRIRQLGAKVSAHGTLLDTRPFSVTSCLLRAFGYQINEAGKELLWLSSAYEDRHTAVKRYRVEVALRLPHSNEDYAKSIIRDQQKRRQRSAALKAAREPAAQSSMDQQTNT
jgi:hypothetical protein